MATSQILLRPLTAQRRARVGPALGYLLGYGLQQLDGQLEAAWAGSEFDNEGRVEPLPKRVWKLYQDVVARLDRLSELAQSLDEIRNLKRALADWVTKVRKEWDNKPHKMLIERCGECEPEDVGEVRNLSIREWQKRLGVRTDALRLAERLKLSDPIRAAWTAGHMLGAVLYRDLEPNSGPRVCEAARLGSTLPHELAPLLESAGFPKRALRLNVTLNSCASSAAYATTCDLAEWLGNHCATVLLAWPLVRPPTPATRVIKSTPKKRPRRTRKPPLSQDLALAEYSEEKWLVFDKFGEAWREKHRIDAPTKANLRFLEAFKTGPAVDTKSLGAAVGHHPNKHRTCFTPAMCRFRKWLLKSLRLSDSCDPIPFEGARTYRLLVEFGRAEIGDDNRAHFVSYWGLDHPS